MSQPRHRFQDFSKQIKAAHQPSCLSLSLPPSRPEPSRVLWRHASGVLVLFSLTRGRGKGCGPSSQLWGQKGREVGPVVPQMWTRIPPL